MQQPLQVCSVLSLQQIPWICPTLLYQRTVRIISVNYGVDYVVSRATPLYWLARL